MAEYVGIVITGIVEGAHDSFDECLTGREATSVDVDLINFAPGPVGVPAGCTPHPVIEGVWDSWDGSLTGREFGTGVIVVVLEGVQDGWDGSLTGREFISEIEPLIEGFPESTFGTRTAGYIIDKSGNRLSLPVGAVVTLVGDTASVMYDKATKVSTESFYEVFLEGGYDKWYLVVVTGNGKYNLYEKDPNDPVIDGDALPDTRDLGFVKVRFKVVEFGRYRGGRT